MTNYPPGMNPGDSDKLDLEAMKFDVECPKCERYCVAEVLVFKETGDIAEIPLCAKCGTQLQPAK